MKKVSGCVGRNVKKFISNFGNVKSHQNKKKLLWGLGMNESPVRENNFKIKKDTKINVLQFLKTTIKYYSSFFTNTNNNKIKSNLLMALISFKKVFNLSI